MKRTLAILAALVAALILGYAINLHRPAAVTASAGPAPAVPTATPSPLSSVPERAATATAAAGAGQEPTSTVDQGPVAYVEGRHYRLVAHPLQPPDPKVVQVEEFFWYGCPHCLHMESLLSTWVPALPADVHFVRVPDNLGRAEGILHQRAFYAAQDLGVESKIHLPLMTALVVQHQPLFTSQTIANFVSSEAHVDPADFNAQFSSFVVDGEAKRATDESFAYGVTGVPTLVVGGKYLVDSDLPGILEGGGDEGARFARMLQVTRFLVDKVRAEQSRASR